MIDINKNIGIFKIYVNGKLEKTIKNRVMNTVLETQVDVLQGVSPDLEIKYLALGTSDTPVTNSDTALGNEIFRTQYVDRTKPYFNESRHKFIILDNEAVDQIEEIGIFGGSGATSTPNSGTLISRVLWSRDKTGSEEITIIRIDKVERG
jgi:hypothetical protein